MFLVLPVSYEFETSLSPKRVARKLDGELVEYMPTVNILSKGRFMKKYREESVFYGMRTSQTEFRIFHHTAKRRDGGSTGFYGKIEKTPNGSKISGKFRKPLYTYIFGGVWTVALVFFLLMMLALKQYAGVACLAGVWAVGFVAMFWDSKKKYIRAYLDSFPKPKNSGDE